MHFPIILEFHLHLYPRRSSYRLYSHSVLSYLAPYFSPVENNTHQKLGLSFVLQYSFPIRTIPQLDYTPLSRLN